MATIEQILQEWGTQERARLDATLDESAKIRIWNLIQAKMALAEIHHRQLAGSRTLRENQQSKISNLKLWDFVFGRAFRYSLVPVVAVLLLVVSMNSDGDLGVQAPVDNQQLQQVVVENNTNIVAPQQVVVGGNDLESANSRQEVNIAPRTYTTPAPQQHVIAGRNQSVFVAWNWGVSVYGDLEQEVQKPTMAKSVYSVN